MTVTSPNVKWKKLDQIASIFSQKKPTKDHMGKIIGKLPDVEEH
jgi:hypothetical protein